MRIRIHIILFVLLSCYTGCDDLLEPQPVDLLIDNLALNEAKDVPSARIGLYSAFREIASSKVIAGDFTADMLIHNGTFSQYKEIGTKQISASNASVSDLWGAIYRTVYVANFILEKLPGIPGVTTKERESVLAEAHFARGYAYFVGAYTFGDMPKVISTDIEVNKNIGRSPKNEILNLILEDYYQAVNGIPETTVNPGFVTLYAVKAALARFMLYTERWTEAEQYASDVIASGEYELEADFLDIVYTDFTDEAILEVGYTVNDDPGTSSTGLNNLLRGRREIIPSNEAIFALSSGASGDRFAVLSFDFGDLDGTDNGWSVAKYGTADEDNNNIIIFRLAEMYLIRAEARVALDNLAGAEEDINVLRERANAPTVTLTSKSQMESVVEWERYYELAYEGHRWYDLVRTGRVHDVMTAYSSNWKDTYNLWPVPQREILNNPSLAGNQNPGY